MALPLSNRALVSHQANIVDRLRACGAHPWPNGALWQYQDEKETRVLAAHFARLRARVLSYRAFRNTFVVGIFAVLFAFMISPSAGGVLFGFYLGGKFLLQVWDVPTWLTNSVLGDGVYWRDGEKHSLPGPVQEVVDSVRLLFPQANFAVSFIGSDPILRVLLNDWSYPALVWEVNADGIVEIIRPPVA